MRRRRSTGWRRASWLPGLGLVLAALLAGPSGSAAAQETDDIDVPADMRAQPAPAQTTGREGYSGAKPGEPVERKPKRPNLVTWIGFQPQDDGSARLFVQLSSEVAYSQELQNGELVVHLDGARFENSNASRRLDVRFFETALQQVLPRRVSKRRARKERPARSAGIELRITFKNPDSAREARAELRQEEDGYYYLYLEFGPPGIRVSGES